MNNDYESPEQFFDKALEEFLDKYTEEVHEEAN